MNLRRIVRLQAWGFNPRGWQLVLPGPVACSPPGC